MDMDWKRNLKKILRRGQIFIKFILFTEIKVQVY